MKKNILLIISILVIFFQVNGQAPAKLTSGEIYMKLEKLNFLGTVLYVAAHPDDENTRLISYFSNAYKANTAYLSMTRGDGGQNLIGPEIREQLGVMRTQELLAARNIDGGKQFFTRANDFGYSKHPDETFNIWNKKEVLSDVIWVIRKFRPDIIVNRFDHRTPGSNHGHHTGSAMLSLEAFDMTDDKRVFSNQLQHVEPWKAKRLFFNTGWWFYGSRENFEKADKSNLLTIDAGTYYPIIGKSNTEIAAEARSMHKCQGFGSSGTRGVQHEYLEFLKGDKPSSMNDPFEGINTSWTRVKGGKSIGEMIAKALDEYDFSNPSKSVSLLLKIRKSISELDDDHWKNLKLPEIDEIIKHCLGLYNETSVHSISASPGESLTGKVEIVNRSKQPIVLKSIAISNSNSKIELDSTLTYNSIFNTDIDFDIPNDTDYSSPYWLNSKATLGMYNVDDQLLRGSAENQHSYSTTYEFEIEGVPYTISSPIVYKTTDPVKGEVYEPFEIVPAFSVELLSDVFIFPTENSKEIDVIVKAGKDNVKGELQLCHPNGWSVSPEKYDVSIDHKGAEQIFKFELTPPENQEENFIVPLIMDSDSIAYSNSVDIIKYDHIPSQTIVSDASAKVVKLDIQIRGKDIAYIMGAGDKIPESLEQIGYDVDVLELDQARSEKLAKYDALILGVRAYNTVERIQFFQNDFMDYVKNGGTMLVQYNTSRRTRVEDIGPYPLKLSRDRVTVEEAEVRILRPDHEVMNFPNKITSADFENWVQERGLYFPNEWDDKYEAILSSNDPGESPKDGGLLVAKYGKGYYIYTGYSWFRELPPGVPGAYRIFANLISIGKYDKP